ncbi:MAG: ATP-binding protein [Planctomycetaceae bacterium]
MIPTSRIPQSTRVLLVEDDDVFAMVVERCFKESPYNYKLTRAVTVDQGRDELQSGTFDVVMTDLTLPDARRLESVYALRNDAPDLPLVVLTLINSMELAAEAVQAGAQDFIVKDWVTHEVLDRSIQMAIERHKLVAENVMLINALKSRQLQLAQKNAQLRQLVDTAHRFADNVSHEFRTPLTVIREYASLVGDGLLGEVNPDQTEFMNVVTDRVDDLSRMVDDMLDSSKLQAGIMGMHRVPGTVSQIVESVMPSVSLKARLSHVELTYDSGLDCPIVFCDPEKAGRVLINLIANAIKFAKTENGSVHVGVRPTPESNEVEISVSDNGPGIAHEDCIHMFDRFRQLGTATQSSTKGFGLGLNIARELVDLNYGALTVDSVPGEGATFRFTLPIDNWPRVIQRYCERLSRNGHDNWIAVVQVNAELPLTEEQSHEMMAFWQFTQRATDLIRQVSDQSWMLLIACSFEGVERAIHMFESEHHAVSRNRPEPLPAIAFESLGCFSADQVEEVVAIALDEVACSA